MVSLRESQGSGNAREELCLSCEVAARVLSHLSKLASGLSLSFGGMFGVVFGDNPILLWL